MYPEFGEQEIVSGAIFSEYGEWSRTVTPFWGKKRLVFVALVKEHCHARGKNIKKYFETFKIILYVRNFQDFLRIESFTKAALEKL